MAQIIAHNLDEKPRTQDIVIKENYSFNSLLLSPKTLEGLRDSGFHTPSPIQVKAIPFGRCGLDLMIQAKSGTGKTAVFTIIALEMVKPSNKTLQVLIFAPTREIAVQIESVMKVIGKSILGLQVGCFIGGLPFEDDIKKVKYCHIAVGAPGRLKHLVEAGHLKTDSIRLLVLDEADMLMDDSFQGDIDYVIKKLPERKQTLAVSATNSNKLQQFLETHMQFPTYVSPEQENLLLLGMKQFVAVVKSHLNVAQQLTIKNDELHRLLSKISFTQCLIFFNSQLRVESISNILNEKGWKTTSISAAHSQTKRLKAFNSLKNLECRILLSTDLTARGIDAANVDLVINYEVPFNAATYLHRMGRAGRFGSHGICITIAADSKELKQLQSILGEIGGTDFSIAKIPKGEVSSILHCDLRSFEKLSAIVDDRKAGSETSEPDMEADVVSCSLERLSVDESNLEIENIKNFLDKNDKAREEISQKCLGMDSEDLLKNLASGTNFLSTTENEEVISPASLYPWVPVEEGLKALKDVENLWEAETKTKDKRKRKRKQCKKSEQSDSIFLKNVFLYNVSKLLSSDDSIFKSTDFSSIIDSIDNYLNETQQDKNTELQKYFESFTCSDLLNNIECHTREWCQYQEKKNWQPPLEPTDPVENIFKLSYIHMIKSADHWKDVLGDKYVPEKQHESDKMEFDETTEVEEEEEDYDDFEYAKNGETVAQTHMTYSNEQNYGCASSWMPVNSREEEHPYNPQYASYFRYYGHMLGNDALTFEDVPSFSNYYYQWKLQVDSLRDYVQQNIYLQEMCNPYQRGQCFNYGPPYNYNN